MREQELGIMVGLPLSGKSRFAIGLAVDKGRQRMYPPWSIFKTCFGDMYIAEIVVMQYTGLKDKNGREIYEGDIVEYENGNAGYGRPRHEEISRDVIPNLCNHDEYFDDSSWWQTGWVIGNVYEHPELLKGSVTTNEP